MASYLRPRRGKKATATSQLTASAPLKRGEVFFEVPDGGVGSGVGKIKMGDGTTAYEDLPYFLEQPTVDYTNAVVDWTNTIAADSENTNATYAGNIIPSASLKTIFTNLKKLLLNYNSQISSVNTNFISFKNGVDIIVDRCTTYGSAPSSNTPSSIVTSIEVIYNNRYNTGVAATKKGNATAAQVLSGKTFTNSSTVNGTGTMTNNGGTTKSATGSLDSTNSRVQLTIPSNGYYNTSSKLYITYANLASKIGLTAAKILSGNTILGIAGTGKASATTLTGTVSITVENKRNTSKLVNFSTPFSAKPTITLSTSNSRLPATLKSSSAGGFVVNCASSTNSQQTTTVTWTAKI